MFGKFANRLTGQIQRLGRRTTRENGAPQQAPVQKDQGAPIFPELQFIRLAENWVEGSRDPGLWGGTAADNQIFRQYKLQWAPTVTLDFWYRGRPLTPAGANIFQGALAQAHVLQPANLAQLTEVIGLVADGLKLDDWNRRYDILGAQVGPLHSRNVLNLRWEDRKSKRRFMSVYIDAEANGQVVHEIHFSAPVEVYAEHEPFVIDTLRTLQWASFGPPPMSSMPPSGGGPPVSAPVEPAAAPQPVAPLYPVDEPVAKPQTQPQFELAPQPASAPYPEPEPELVIAAAPVSTETATTPSFPLQQGSELKLDAASGLNLNATSALNIESAPSLSWDSDEDQESEENAAQSDYSGA